MRRESSAISWKDKVKVKGTVLWSLEPNGGRHPTLSQGTTSEHNITSKILSPHGKFADELSQIMVTNEICGRVVQKTIWVEK